MLSARRAWMSGAAVGLALLGAGFNSATQSAHGPTPLTPRLLTSRPQAAASCPSPAGHLPGTSIGTLTGIAALSPTDIWTVADGTTDQSTIRHWDGVRWRVAPSVRGGLQALSALSPHDVWAVGGGFNPIPGQPLAAHWDGTRWQAFTMSPPISMTGTLVSVSADRPRDVWAVGSQDTYFGQTQDLVEHWDGTRWREVLSPNPGRHGSALNGVVALAPNDVWAVGRSINAPWRTLTLHWDGTRWQVIPSPNASPFNNLLYTVAARSSHDIWAGGDAENVRGLVEEALLEHWDGMRWRLVPSPATGCPVSAVFGLAAVSGHDVWAVGMAARDLVNGPWGTLAAHWDGTRWRVYPSPNPGPAGSTLAAVAALSGTAVWAVGGSMSLNTYNPPPQETVVERWNSRSWGLIRN